MSWRNEYNYLEEPFKPFIKRYGFMYVHFINNTHLTSKEFGELVTALKNNARSKFEYEMSVKHWCNENITP